MIKEPQIRLRDLIMCLSSALDLVSPGLVNHQKRVAYIALSIANEMGLPLEDQNSLVLAGLLHDSGAFSLRERLDILQFEMGSPHKHAEIGYLLLKGFEPFSKAALLVRHHHVPWNKGAGAEFRGEPVALGSHILHLADRVEVSIRKQQEVLGQVERICKRVKDHSGKMFAPEVVSIFNHLDTHLAAKEYFWLDATSPSLDTILNHQQDSTTISIGLEGLLSLANLFRQIIDFRSPFTATHTSGVAATAEALARRVDFSERECLMMKVAGYLHDLGKLAVPTEILEKPAKLTEAEFNIIRSHTYHTYRILAAIPELDTINTWGSFHHERLDGTGYPFHHKGQDLSLGSRIMAVADEFTAITEDRPYRKGMTTEQALQVLQRMASSSALDSSVVSVLRLHYDEVNSIRIAAQQASSEEYQEFGQHLG